MSRGQVGFWAAGVPIPQGSKSLGKNKATGRATMYDANKGLKPWREVVAGVARKVMVGQVKLDGPCSVDLAFYLPRPAGHYKKDGSLRATAPAVWCEVKPDLDKLERAILDALTAAGVWADDARAVILRSSKRYADEPHQAGVNVLVTPLRVGVRS
ncbi:RusA-like resolvase [Arthrobacter phage Lunar]|uniref:RusA-like resolvase n=4 Tax=Coralvirus coral TaxID=2734227 RepID=A0A5J6TQP3_9CAUD|nr:RusA-like resolvase [Arthrobacter phage Cote]AYN58450.1 RusA-like resolvase [Arthrobacter phage Lunar]AYN58799.1 RusA-like resolvase [Arthrobacter phage Polka]QFG13095.1 RusA-like resolvase [Arthrobacter phage Amelia]